MRSLLMILSIVLAPTLARAQLEVCNANQQNVTVAIAVHGKDAPSFGGAGWYTLQPSETAVLVPIRLDTSSTDYLVSVHNQAGVDLPGPTSICTSISTFNYPNYVWGPTATCRAGFVLRKYSPLSDAGFWQTLPIGTALDRRQCRWKVTNPATHRVEGFAYVEGAGPAPNETVTLRFANQPNGPTGSTRTGADGTFAFVNLQVAGYTLSVDSPAYSGGPVSVVIQPGQDTKAVPIQLTKK